MFFSPNLLRHTGRHIVLNTKNRFPEVPRHQEHVAIMLLSGNSLFVFVFYIHFPENAVKVEMVEIIPQMNTGVKFVENLKMNVIKSQ